MSSPSQNPSGTGILARYLRGEDFYTFTASALSGGVANAISRTCVAPFERTRLQMAVDPHYTSMLHCFKHITNSEGIRGLWRGNLMNVYRIFPQGAAAFFLKDSVQGVYPDSFRDSKLAQPAAAMVSGILSMSLVYPLDYIRIRMTTVPGIYSSFWQGLKRVYQSGGVSGLYEGLKYANYWGGLYYCVQFTAYDQLRPLWVQYNGSMDTIGGLVLGSLAGLLSVTVAYPLEAIRRKLQTQGLMGRPILYTGARDCARQIVSQHGFKHLYKGLGANLVKTPPSVGITFACYEFFMNRVFKCEVKKKHKA